MAASPLATGNSAAGATWQPLGPTAVLTPDFGLVTGRISAVALDPSDATGNHLYIGTTGGGVWSSSNAGASNLSAIVFNPLTDAVTALAGAEDASISIGALTVQPGGTGVILAGTGDPNDALDSYYGAGILRSTNGGNSWSLIQGTSDVEDGLGARDVVFSGEGFAGFAWSAVNPLLVVAAVAQSYEGDVVDADESDGDCEGLFYSSDSGATWHMATITDGSGAVVQSPSLLPLGPSGNAATSVVWNPVRRLFIAAVRYHGYYQSPDGITWTRLADQPSAGLTTVLCPALLADVACPIYRGALAVNPLSGDTFAWTVDGDNQDQGLWQDKCAISGGACTNATITFAQRWNTTALETSTLQGAATIANGNYNLALAAVPSSQDTLVLAGANDLWKCSLASGCVWRNTTNSTTCMSSQVGEFQHALAWNTSNPQEIFLGNDSGLWRSTDAIGETGSACSSSDSTHFQNLNGSLGSLAEVESLSPVVSSSYTLMAGLGVNGVAGVKSAAVTTDWPQIFSGYGGPVAVDSKNTNNWYINDQPGVAIYLCSQAAPCTPSAFGTTPVVSDADVGGDGDAMPLPAPFLVDTIDDTQLLVGTCRVWRGPASGSGWTSANAISRVLSGAASAVSCNGNTLIRAMAALPLASGGEIIYLGMYGPDTGGSLLPGHVLSAVYNPASSSAPTWIDLTLNSVVNSARAFNYYDLDISSITIDSHDASGNTVYITVEGMPNQKQEIETVYRTTNGGSAWTDISSNLPYAPASSVAVDPQSANTVYVATDTGVYFTPQVASCGVSASSCWSVFGAGLPAAPAVALSAAPASASTQVLVAATYGRGIWQTPLFTAATALSAASVNPASYTFPDQSANSTSSAVAFTLLNTGSIALVPTAIAMTGDFGESVNCVNQSIAPGLSCTISVTFTPQAVGPLSGQMIIYANVYGGQLSADFNGTGTMAALVTLTPPSESYGQIEAGTISSPLTITVGNSSLAAIPITGVSVSAPFVLSGNGCGTSSLAANTDCPLQVEFAPTTAGAFTGQLILIDGAGTQTVQLSGTGVAAPTDILNPPASSSLTFAATPDGQPSAAQSVTITNSGGLPLTGIAISISGQFQQVDNCGAQLAAGAVCTISVVFVPTQPGALTGTLTISDALRIQTVSLSGTGVAPPVFSITPSSLTFTNTQPGVASAPQTLTIGNAGGSSMANIGFAFTGPAALSYSVSATTCGALLNNGSSCTAQIVFTPSATGSITAALVVSSSTAGVAAVSVPLNGSGQTSGGFAANPTSLSFAADGVGQSSAAQSVTFTNSSSSAISSVTLAVSGPFAITQNGCTGGLAAGANCTASVFFVPSTSGSATGTLTASSTSLATPVSVALSGIGFDFTLAFSGPSSETVVAGQQADYTLVLTPIGAGGTFTFVCGTLPANALCLFNPTTETLNAGVQGNVLIEISTTINKARLEKPEFGRPGEPGFWRALPLTCGLLLLPLATRRRRKFFQLVLLLAVMACGISSCTSSGGGSGGSGGSGGGGGGTPTGSYTIPVTVTAGGISHVADVVLTVD